MASIRKLPSGRWQAQVMRVGVRKSKSFVSKLEAKDWAAREEYLISDCRPKGATVTLGEAFNRYASEVSPKKRGERWEVVRLRKLRKDAFASILMADLTPSDFATWRDQRLGEVSPGTVKREMELVSGVLAISRQEWGYLVSNPMAEVRRPAKPAPRNRLVSDRELEALAISAGGDLSNATARAFHAFLFAIETAMRSGEILELTWAHVDIESRVAHLPMTKNGTSRDVPLSSEAVRLLGMLPHADPIFDLDATSRDALWRKLRDRAGVVGLTFHDARHSAITKLARRLDVLDLARMVGHKNVAQLMTYYNESAASIAQRLG
ncbi:site-specific integrase [Loktanella sp. D2R18]|uniref:tyrosine-type recombinase/integrase n=1 Tax=Yoonia sp. 1_MG-2023 TaxID=3062659 RepID=UPI000DEA51F4|nr:site-specific integrase [Yoonia sp. 1_MG-2023]MDO6591726.1 site-specific integrase [Yoonia sp. 1_MG-2023]RBW42547.1 site-specific integrase [Loktanella sp. D2R18]